MLLLLLYCCYYCLQQSNELEKCLEEFKSVNGKLTTELNTISTDLDTAESLLGKLNKNKMVNEGHLEEVSFLGVIQSLR